MKKTILFDLDGTLVDSGPGITKCAQYALDHFGIHEPETEKLAFFVGPPLMNTFMEHYGFSEEQAKQAVAKYRERYHKTGIFECELYPDVEEVLATFKEKGYRTALASSKPESSCKKILEHFSILSYFDEVTGAEMNGPRNEKVDVLIEALRRMEKKPEECVLIGDTRFDAIGAAKLNMECIGVSYGYGTAEELLAEGAKVVLPSMKEVERYLVEHEN
jgi:phosphoglycolate phosphatase